MLCEEYYNINLSLSSKLSHKREQQKRNYSDFAYGKMYTIPSVLTCICDMVGVI